METYKTLTEACEKAKNEMKDTLRKFPWSKKEAYGEFLAQTYFYVSYTTRHMALAAARCNLNKKDLHNKLLGGAYEEINHEDMITKDMTTLNLQIKSYHEMQETTAFYNSTRDLIEQMGPEALLAYSIPIESMCAEGDFMYEAVVNSHGKEAGTFLEEHCILDKEHAHENMEFIKTLEADQMTTIIEALPTATRTYCSIIKAIVTKYQ